MENLNFTPAWVYNQDASEYLKINFPYRLAKSKWAGGHTIISVFIIPNKQCLAKGHSNTVLSHNRKWTGLNASYIFGIMPDELIELISGKITVFKKSDKHILIKKCTWWEQSTGFTLKKKQGFLVGRFHSTALTENLAIVAANRAIYNMIPSRDLLLTIPYITQKYGFCKNGIETFMAANGIGGKAILYGDLYDIIKNDKVYNAKHYRTQLMQLLINTTP